MPIARLSAALSIATAAVAMPFALPARGAGTAIIPAAQDQQDEDPQVVTRVYSLRPLVAEARQSAATVQAGVWLQLGEMTVTPRLEDGGGPGAGGPAEADDVVKQVMQILTSTIDPDSWQENGGTPGTITYLPINSRLIVTHTAEAHARVAKLIDELQDRQVVSVRGRLVRMPEAQVEQNTRVVDGVAIWQAEPADLPVLAQVRFSGFDGQAQHVASGRSVGYFQSVTPIVAANAVGYQPSTSDLQTGLVLQATPILNVDGNSATLQINAQYILLDDPQPVTMHWQRAPDAAHALGHLTLTPTLNSTTQQLRLEAHIAPTTQAGAVGGAADGYWVTMPPSLGVSAPVLPDRLSVHRRVLETSLRVPVGQWVLVGTLGASADGEPTQEEPLHLLIRIDAGGARQ